MRTLLPLALTAGLGLAVAGAAPPASTNGAPARNLVALKAGTIHLVEDGRVIEGGGTVLVDGNRIVAVGSDVAVPLDAKVVDYGPSAVICPGFVSADSGFGSGNPSVRTADAGVKAVENFDFFSRNSSTLAGGVTSVYLRPSPNRLISGEGAVVKLAGSDPERRTLKAAATIDGAIHSGARNAPGYWDPPVPATVDVGIGYQKPQLPKTTMGAIVALTEILAGVRGEADVAEEYGPYVTGDLGSLIEAGLPWRITAQTESEIRAILDFATQNDVPLILDGATYAKGVAAEIAAAGVPVVYEVPFSPNTIARDRGKDPDALRPSYDVPAALVAAGARVAITGTGSTSDLLFNAVVASQGKLDPAAALRAITLTPAEIYGVQGRVGSIAPGKDADLVVLDAAPLSGSASVLATWVDGELAWSIERSGPRDEAGGRSKASRAGNVVIEVDELHLGDGRVLSPGRVVVENGRIVSVTRGSGGGGGGVVRGAAAMPGIVDAYGHLGLEGSRRVPSTDFRLSTIVAPGDRIDRLVARAGVTTVLMAPRDTSGSGAPAMAYKPSASSLEGLVVADPAAVHLRWSEPDNRLASGDDVRELLAKAVEYRQEWVDYEKAMAEWVPPPPEPEEEADDEEDEEDDGKDDEEKDEDDDDSKKKKDDDAPEPDPITGVWEAQVARPPLAEPHKFRMQLSFTPDLTSPAVFPAEDEEDSKKSKKKKKKKDDEDEEPPLPVYDGTVVGNLRCAAVTDGLIDVEGYYVAGERKLTLRGLGSQGWVSIEAEYEEARLTGTIDVGGTGIDLEAERTSQEYVVAKRSRRRAEKQEEADPPKGKPKEPRLDGRLEPLRRALEGKTSVIVTVDREDEILACVDAFEEVGIRPVLYEAEDAHYVAGDIAGRVAGILLSHRMKVSDVRRGTDARRPYAELQAAGIPVAFRSNAEEGAVDLPLMALYAVAQGMTPTGAVRALTADAAAMLRIDDRVGLLEPGRDGDILLLDGPPLAPGTSVVRVWVNGEEIR